jgi:prepilin-type N-terminal cleavage/methylation domain-containing protein
VISIRSFDSALRIGFNHHAPMKGQGVRHGMTLLELIVVIALLGLILAIAAPAFIVPGAPAESELTTVVATARRAAIVRGEPVTLALIDDGAWRIDGDASPTASPIASGKLAASVGAIRIRVSPMGTCVADAPGVTTADWNALDCRFGREPAERPAR